MLCQVGGDPLFGAGTTEVGNCAGQIHANVDLPVGVRDLVDLLAPWHGLHRNAGHTDGPTALEQAAVTWQAGQHQPDALAALVVAHDVLVRSAGQQWGFVSPVDVERRMRAQPITSIPEYLRRRIDGSRPPY